MYLSNQNYLQKKRSKVFLILLIQIGSNVLKNQNLNEKVFCAYDIKRQITLFIKEVEKKIQFRKTPDRNHNSQKNASFV